MHSQGFLTNQDGVNFNICNFIKPPRFQNSSLFVQTGLQTKVLTFKRRLVHRTNLLEVEEIEQLVVQVLVLDQKATLLHVVHKLFDVVKPRRHLGYLQKSPSLHDPIRLQQKVPQIGSHQRQAEHDHVDRVRLERGVGHVARNHAVVRCHQIQRVHLVGDRFREASLTTAKVRNDVVFRPENDDVLLKST